MDTGGSEVTTERTLTNLYVYEEKACNSELNERYWVTVYIYTIIYDMDNDSTLNRYTIINCCRGEKVIVTVTLEYKYI